MNLLKGSKFLGKQLYLLKKADIIRHSFLLTKFLKCSKCKLKMCLFLRRGTIMDNFWVASLFWIGLAAVIVSAFYLPRRMMKKKKQLDERYVMNDHLARSYSWFGSLGVIFIVWFLSLVVFHSMIAFWLITVTYVGHMLSYAIGSAIANGRN